LVHERAECERRAKAAPLLPASIPDLRAAIEEALRGVATDSTEGTLLLRKIVIGFRVHLVRLIDGGHPLPRATLTLNLAALNPALGDVPGVEVVLTRTVTIDLFVPPQRERIRADVARLAAAGVEQRTMIGQLPERVTQAAVSRAIQLNRMMEERGLSSPYVELTAPPDDYPKLRRHRHKRYRFRPYGENGLQAG
jgi:hypothetical protein